MKNESFWRTACEEFLEVAELPAAQRGSYLGCLEPALRRGVESLLDADAEADRFLEQPACPRHVADSLKAAAQDSLEFRLGPYRLDRELSQSQMSRVFLARRDDGEYEKVVAVKVISHDASSDDLLERFRRERQILAKLDHPNIARLLDGGTASDGLPYFVMEYVEGTPIDTYCDRRRLSVRKRIDLFLEVCSTVEYAHQHDVVHRDLKASNILVTRGGVPKLLDFGIAKLLSPVEGSTVGVETDPDARPMTPYYASPEQIVGGAITPATDIYSLGVLLFKLLCGRFPYRVGGQSSEAVKSAVLRQEPESLAKALSRGSQERPWEAARIRSVSPDTISRDRGTTSVALRRALAGELDNIVQMALSKEPDRRYGSAGQFADDLCRFVASLPVNARGGGLGYRSRKFVVRNRQRLVVAVLLFWAVVALSAVSMRSREVAAERDRLVRKRAQAEAVVEFLEGMFRVPRGQFDHGLDKEAEKLLQLGARRAVRKLEQDPELGGLLLQSIGDMYADLEMHRAAAPRWARLTVEADGDLGSGAEDPARRVRPRPVARTAAPEGSPVHGEPLAFPDGSEAAWSPKPSLAITGTCPGEVRISVTDATPGGSVLVAGAAALGSRAVERGVCAGTPSGLAEVRVVGTTIVGTDGSGMAERRVPPAACSGYFQAVDYATCRTGPVLRLVTEPSF